MVLTCWSSDEFPDIGILILVECFSVHVNVCYFFFVLIRWAFNDCYLRYVIVRTAEKKPFIYQNTNMHIKHVDLFFFLNLFLFLFLHLSLARSFWFVFWRIITEMCYCNSFHSMYHNDLMSIIANYY